MAGKRGGLIGKGILSILGLSTLVYGFIILIIIIVILTATVALMEEDEEFGKVQVSEKEEYKEKGIRINRTLPTGDKGDRFYYPVNNATVKSLYGSRPLGWHTGIDLASKAGDSIYPARPGKVVAVKTLGCSIPKNYSDNTCEGKSYALHIIIEHKMSDGSKMYTLYAHLSRILVEEGQTVDMGTEIGKEGNTGNSYGAHLHFEIAKGFDRKAKRVSNQIDPMLMMNKKLKKSESTKGLFMWKER